MRALFLFKGDYLPAGRQGSVGSEHPDFQVGRVGVQDFEKDKRAISSVGSEHMPYKHRVGGSTPSSPTEASKMRLLHFMYFVYIIYSEKLDKYYLGSTDNIEGRIRRHNQGNKAFTSKGKPWVLVYKEEFDIKTEAIKREFQLKKWKNRERLESLISKGSEHPD